MLIVDEDALICDLAETYNIYDIRSLSPTQVATFAIGLRDDSRIKLKLTDTKIDLDRLMLASIVDRLSILMWWQTENGKKGVNPPKMFVQALTRTEEEPKEEIKGFDTIEDFDKALAEFDSMHRKED